MQHPDIQVVDEHDQPLYGATFADVYAKGLRHRIVRMVVVDGQGRWLLQKRGQVKLYPNCWDISAAGHVDVGETYEVAARRELQEELGISGVLEVVGSFQTHRQTDDKHINRITKLYKVVVQDDATFTVPPDEVSKVEWFAVDEVKALMATHPDQVADGLVETVQHFYA